MTPFWYKSRQIRRDGDEALVTVLAIPFWWKWGKLLPGFHYA